MNLEKGSALYFSLVILSLLLIMVFGLGAVMTIQLQTIRRSGDSVAALCAADTGIEMALQGIFAGTLAPPVGLTPGTLGNGASFVFSISNRALDSNCLSDYYCIKSIGSFREAKRGIEVRGR